MDFAGFLIAAYGVTALNLLFLYQWYLETVHGQHWFYLLTFSVPFWLNAAVNPQDATEPLLIPENRQRVKAVLIAEDLLQSEIDRNLDENVEIHNDHEIAGDLHSMDTDEEMARWMRGGLLFLFVFWTIQEFSLGLISIARWPGMLKAWNWPQWTSVVILVIGILIQTLNGIMYCFVNSRTAKYCVKCERKVKEEIGAQSANEETREDTADL